MTEIMLSQVIHIPQSMGMSNIDMMSDQLISIGTFMFVQVLIAGLKPGKVHVIFFFSFQGSNIFLVFLPIIMSTSNSHWMHF